MPSRDRQGRPRQGGPRRLSKRSFEAPSDSAVIERHSPRQLEPLTPGTPVARRLNLSRVPVREALRLLESQGVVVSMRYRGMRLIEVSADGLRKIL